MGLLTLKEACITTALSKRWRTLFHSLPRLDFSFSFGHSSVRDQEIDIECWLEWVRDILESRRAPVRICTIRSSHFNQYCEDFGNIICFLCNHGIQELTIETTVKPLQPFQHYTVPSCLFSCSTATRIDLFRCILKVPSKFCLLRRLNVLRIEECIVEDVDMQRLILGCPAVESLTLQRCRRLRNFQVDAPKLAVLDVGAYRPLALSILRAPQLESVTYRFLYDFDHNTLPGDEGNDTDEGEVRRLVRLVESLGNIQNLELEFQTMREGVAVPVTLRPILPKMKKLTLRMLPSNTYELSVLSCFLNCCPKLEDLVVGDEEMDDCQGPDDSLLGYWNQQMPSDCVRNTLSTVTLRGVGLDCHWTFVVELVKFLLNNAGFLKKLIIQCVDIQKEKKEKMSKMVEDLQRAMLLLSPASPDAVVQFKAAGGWMVYRPAQFTFGGF